MSFLVILAPFTNLMQNTSLFSMIKHASLTPQSRVPTQSPFCDMTLEKNNTHCQGIKLLRSFKRWRLEVGVDKNEVNCAWIIRINSAWNFPSRKMKPAKKGRGRHYSSLFGPDHTFKGRRPKFCSMTLFSTPSQQIPFQTSTINNTAHKIRIAFISGEKIP